MKAFLSSIAILIIVSAAAAVVLDYASESSTRAYTDPDVRL